MTALRERLLEVFEVEYREHVEAMRAILATPAAGAPELNEATRRAHTLKGAARAVGLADVEGLAHGLESLFASARSAGTALDADMRQQVADALDEIEDLIAASQAPAAPFVADAEDGAVDEGQAARATSVRVGALQIDALFRSASELHGDLVRQREMSNETGALSADAAALTAHWARRSRGGATDEFGALVAKVSRRATAAAAAHSTSTSLLRRHLQQLDARVRQAGMLSAGSVFGGFRKMIRDLAVAEGKRIAVDMDGLDCEADRLVLQRIKDPVMHLLRNAVSHGIEAPTERRASGKDVEGRVRLAVSAERGRLSIVVEDDGRGVDFASVAARAVELGLIAPERAAKATPDELALLLFEPGLSTAQELTRISGRGVGLSVAREAVAGLDGTIRLSATPGAGTRIEISLPLSVLARRLLVVSFGEQEFAIPCDVVVRALHVPLSELASIEGRPAVRHDGAPVPLVSLGQLVDDASATIAANAERLPVVVVRAAAGRMAVAVEGFGAVGDFTVRPLDVATGDRRAWSGVTLTPAGRPCLVMSSNAFDDIASRDSTPLTFETRGGAPAEKPLVLVVDDSVTTRTLEKSILEAEGYRVRLSVDGADAISQLRAEPVDLVVSDIEMPRVDGFALLQAMKDDERLADIPVILVTSRADAADRERGMRLGADAYVVKQKFDQVELLKTIRQVI